MRAARVGCVVRDATGEDAAGVAALYCDYVLTSTATFEVVPPDAAEIARRIEAVRGQGMPYLVAQVDGRLAGYGYAGQFRPRPAYRFTVEDSIYVAAEFQGKGVGGRLLGSLIDRARAAGARQMVAAIGGENPASIALHAAHGFVSAGVLRGVGWKFEQWLDLTLLQRAL